MRWNRELLGIAIGVGLSAGLTGTSVAAEETYIPLVSKGFQHQFWQAVRSGAEQAGKHRSNPLVAGLPMESLVPVLRNLDLRQLDRRRDNGEIEILCQHVRDR